MVESQIPSTYFTYFQQRTYSTPSTECRFYDRLTRVFNIPVPEDHSNINLAQYLKISNQYEPSDHSDLLITTTTEASTATTNIGTTIPERNCLKIYTISYLKHRPCSYVILTISLLFVTILVIVIAVKLKTVCLKKKPRDTESYDLENRNTTLQ